MASPRWNFLSYREARRLIEDEILDLVPRHEWKPHTNEFIFKPFRTPALVPFAKGKILENVNANFRAGKKLSITTDAEMRLQTLCPRGAASIATAFPLLCEA